MHLQIYAEDPAKLPAFYRVLLGWKAISSAWV